MGRTFIDRMAFTNLMANIVQTLHKHYMNIAQTPDKLFGALYRERRFIDRMAFTNLMAVVELFRSLIAS